MGCGKSKKLIVISSSTLPNFVNYEFTSQTKKYESDYNLNKINLNKEKPNDSEISNEDKVPDNNQKRNSKNSESAEKNNYLGMKNIYKSIKSESDKKSIRLEAICENLENPFHGEKSPDMRLTLKAIFQNILKINPDYEFTFSDNKNSDIQLNASIKDSINSEMKSSLCQNRFLYNIRDGNISVGSIFTVKSILSEENTKNLLDDIDEETEYSYNTTINPYKFLDTSDYHTIQSSRSRCNSNTGSNYITCDAKSNYLDVKYISNKEISSSKVSSAKVSSLNLNSFPKNYLKVNLDLFTKENNTYKKVFVLNLLKALYEVFKFLQMEKKHNNRKNDFFAYSGIMMNKYKMNYDHLNNYSSDLDIIFQGQEHDKEFMFPLYQIISNNLEIEQFKLMKIRNPLQTEGISSESQEFSHQHEMILDLTNTIINEKFQILDEISKDEVHGIWSFHKCLNLKKNKICSIKIINKKAQNNLGFRNFTEHDIIIENKMVCLKYSLKIKEMINSNSYDYIITEYVDCSLYDLVLNKNNVIHNYFSCEEKFLPKDIIWKIMRDFLVAIDYFHNIANIAHRNLNLKNIFFIKKDISLRISDYSLSSFLINNEEVLPIDKHRFGFFPSPEYFEDYSGIGDDMWAFGVIMFFILNHYLPCEIMVIPPFFEIPKNEKNYEELNVIIMGLLNQNLQERFDLDKLKKNSWITLDKEFPIPNVCNITIEYLQDIMKKKIQKFSI